LGFEITFYRFNDIATTAIFKEEGKMRKTLVGLILILTCTLALGLMAHASELVIATAEEIEGTDIQQIEWENIVHAMVTVPMIRYNQTMTKVEPFIVSKWSLSKDGKTMRLKFPRGLTFTSGTPLTAEAAKASFERYLKISPYATDLEALDKMTVEGDELIMHWKAPPVPALVSLASTYGGLVDVKAAAKGSAEEFNRKVVGYGPMMIEKWVQGSHVSLTRNPNFKSTYPAAKNHGPIAVDKVTVRFIADDFTRVTEVQSGNVDIIFRVPLENVEELEADSNIVLHKYLQPGCLMFYVNPEAPNLTDVRVRRALQKGVNREELVAVLAGNATVRHGIMSPSMAGFSQEYEDRFAQKYGYDFKTAGALLDEAGWKDSDGDGIRDQDGKKLTITAMIGTDYPSSKKTAPVVQAQYKKLGVDLKLREFEGKYIKQAVRDKKFDLGARRYNWADGDMLTYLFHTASKNYSFPEIDKLVDQGRYELDPVKRAEIYGKAQELVLEKGLAVPLVTNVNYVAVRKNIVGFSLSVDGQPYFTDLKKK
jgi:peptide/nickel transport system substrate-binding protein